MIGNEIVVHVQQGETPQDANLQIEEEVYANDRVIDIDVMNDGESSEYDDSSDVDYVPPKDDEEYYVYCGEEDANVVGDDNDAETAMVEDNETMFGVIDSDDEMIRHETNSDDEINIMKFSEFNAKTDMKDPQFCVGMIFADSRTLRAAIREKAIQQGWEAAFYKSDNKRVNMVCKAGGCPFEIAASRIQQDEDSLMIRKINPEHKCGRVNENSMVRVPYLVEKFKDRIRMNPDWSVDSLRQTMSSEVKAKVSIQQAYRTKKATLGLVEKSHKEQYSRVIDYAAELKRVDSNTTVDIKCSFAGPGQDPIFKRMYVCLGACKMGFRTGCRPLLGLDGCHLKSPYGGQLLSAVGLDANNTSWVVAYAMVEQECKDSWIWFLELLAKDVNITNEGVGWTFISDKQKGLLQAFEMVVSYADLRFCVRHLLANFHKIFSAKKLNGQLWAIAKSTTLAYFEKEMMVMKQLEPSAVDWLTGLEPNSFPVSRRPVIFRFRYGSRKADEK